MKKKELLQLIQALENEVSQLKGRIVLLEAKVSLQQPIITVPSIWTDKSILNPLDQDCIGGGQHEYPFPWYGINPAPCKKCGKTAPPYTVTCTTK